MNPGAIRVRAPGRINIVGEHTYYADGFVMCVAIGMIASRIQTAGVQSNAIDYRQVDISTSASLNLASLVIIQILAALYTVWW